MPSSFDNLFRALKAHGEDSLTCQECEERLSEYVVAEINASTALPQWDDMRLHLAQCPHCTAAWHDLRDLVLEFEAGAGPVPADLAAADLSFLTAEAVQNNSPAKLWRFDDLGRLLINFSADFRRSLQQLLAQPGHAAAGLKTAASAGTEVDALSIASPDHNLDVTVSFERLREQLTEVRAVIHVNIPGRGGWPNLAGSTVVLRRSDQVLATRITDAYGKAVFDGLVVAELDQLLLEVSPVA